MWSYHCARGHALSSCTHMIIEWIQNLFKFLKLYGEAYCDRKNHGDKRRSLQKLAHSKRIAQFYVRPHGMGDCEFTETGRTDVDRSDARSDTDLPVFINFCDSCYDIRGADTDALMFRDVELFRAVHPVTKNHTQLKGLSYETTR